MQAEYGPREMLIILACLTGVLLGLSFNILVLLPFTIAGAVAYAFIAPGQGFGAAATSLLIPAVALQAGYMIGLTGRDTLAQLRAKLNVTQSKRV